MDAETITAGAVADSEAIVAQLRSLFQDLIDTHQAEPFDLDAVTAATNLLSLPLDSLALQVFMAGIEERFDIYVPDEQAFAFVKVADVVAFIQTRLAAKQARARR